MCMFQLWWLWLNSVGSNRVDGRYKVYPLTRNLKELLIITAVSVVSMVTVVSVTLAGSYGVCSDCGVCGDSGVCEIQHTHCTFPIPYQHVYVYSSPRPLPTGS